MKPIDTSCLFCRIAQGSEPAEKVWENNDFMAIKNKYPDSPLHLLVIPKWHIEKSETRQSPENFWKEFFEAVWMVVKQEGLDVSGYVIQNNGAGYNHFEHEHIHIKSGMPKAN